MPKNAVQRLQDIENDINTVISLYEVANKLNNTTTTTTNNNNDKSETSKKQNSQQLPQISAPRKLEAVPRFDKFREVPGKPETSLSRPFQKTSGFIARPSEGLNPRESVLKKWMLHKPGSAPSSSSTISTSVESDYIRQQPSDVGITSDRIALEKAKTFDNLSGSPWLSQNDFPAFPVVMTPSKTLETAKEILEKNNFTGKTGSGKSQPVLHYEEKGKEKNSADETVNRSLDVKKSRSRKTVSDVTQRNKEEKNLERSRSISPRQNISVQHIFEYNLPVTSKSVIAAKVYSSKEKALPADKLSIAHEEEPKMDRKVSSSGTQKNAKPNKTKQVSFKTKNPSKENSRPDTGTNKTALPEKNNSILKQVEKPAFGDKVENNIRGVFEKDKIVQFSQCYQPEGGTRTNEKTEKPEKENEDAEVWVNELSKIIEKGNEKLEKMKVSKELALDIAKHFKEKYDEIQKSKGELLEQLKMAEKKNEMLNTEIKEAREKIAEGSGEDKSHEAKEHEQPKYLMEEIQCLRAKLCETERQCNEKLLQKNKKIEEIQMNRLAESKNALKNQEILAKLQKLTQEKCDLLSKFDEIRRQLRGSQATTQNLEENIRQLEEEVQKQKQHLKIKTETLHETNRELEMIRLNCTDLEEQVKMLRKSMEEFDGIQHSLIRKTTEYEQQIKANQEKIKELQDENVRLKGELDKERDGLRIKVKIIEDQQQTIRQLKEKSEDAKTLLKRNQSLERVLNIEREEKLELQDALQRLKRRKEELKNKVKTLENDFLLAPQEVVRDLQKTQLVLRELENQVQMKQKEWELQLHSLIKEKEQACSVAEFATKKLMETTTEFQKQSAAYKGLQRLVAGNLAVKERQQLHEANKRAMRNL